MILQQKTQASVASRKFLALVDRHSRTRRALAAAKRKLNRRMLVQAMERTAQITSFVLFILIGSSVFSLTFRAVDGDLWVEHLLTSLPGGAVGFLIFVNVLVFLLAFFLDFFEISFIILPLLAPVAEKLGIDLVWFGVLLGVNMQTSFMHPPFGFALFYLRSVAPPQVKTTQIYRGAIPFLGIQLFMVVLIIAFPELVGSGSEAAKARPVAPVEVIVPAEGGSSLLDSQDFGDLFTRPPAGKPAQ